MPHLRQNLVTKQWVIVSPERAQRPHSLSAEQPSLPPGLPVFDPDCPFCPEQGRAREHVLWQYPLQGDWRVRVLHNKYPALDLNGDLHREFDGVERSMSGVGYHEIVVEGRAHNLSPATADPDLLYETFLAFQERGRILQQDRRIDHIQYFKNHGQAAGATLAHPHSQLVALPVVPYSKRARAEEARRYFDDVGRCAYCLMLEEEERRDVRIVAANEQAVAFVLYAAFSPFHIWVLPRHHFCDFLDAPEEDVRGVATCLHSVLRRLYEGLNDPPYNYVLRSCPLRDHGREYLHWYVSVVPRLATNAGFELGSGMFINPTLPEESADFLRNLSEEA